MSSHSNQEKAIASTKQNLLVDPALTVSNSVSREISSHDPEPDQAPATTGEGHREMKGSVWAIVVLSILSSTFLFSLDNTIVANVQPKILEDFGNIEKLPWVSVAFSLGAICVSLIWGKIYEEYNNKYLFLVAVFIFEIGSAVCGSAPSLNVLIVGRAICGLGGPGLYLGTITILTALTRVAERPLYMSFVGATWASGTVLGPVIGGAFADSSATWRWSFYINLCVAGAAAPVYFFLLPPYRPKPGHSLRQRIGNTDLVGIILIVGAYASGIMAIAFGGSMYSWRSGQIIGLFVCSGVLWILVGVQQAWNFFTNKNDQLFPAEYLKSYEMWILFAQTAASISCVFIPIYFIPLFFQFVRNDSALESAVRLLPFVFIVVFAGLLNGSTMAKYGIYMPWFLVGGILVTIGGALFYTVKLDSSTGTIYGYSVITAFGAGLFTQAPFSIAQAKVEPDRVPRVTAFINCAQMSGIVLSLAISSSVFINESTSRIGRILPYVPRATVQNAIAGASASFFESMSPTDRARVLEAIVRTIDHIYIMVVVGGALAVVLSLFMKRERVF